MVEEEKVLPFAGVHCKKERDICKLWWLATIGTKTHTVELRVPIEIKTLEEERKKEIELEDTFKDSTVMV